MQFIWVIEWTYGRQESPHLALFMDARDGLAMSQAAQMAIIQQKMFDNHKMDRYDWSRATVSLCGCYLADDQVYYIEYG